MGITRHYAQAPITEAIIDLRVDARMSLKLPDLEPFAKSVELDYPTQRKQSLTHGRFEIGNQLSTSASSQDIGYVFVTVDEKQIIQARLDGFTLSRLAPYERWESFRNEARKRWQIYRVQMAPRRVTRLAVRYINRISIPATQIEMKDYFRTSPEISPDLPQVMDGFFFHVALPLPDIRSHVLLNQTVVPPPPANMTSVILDIDLFATWRFRKKTRQFGTSSRRRTIARTPFSKRVSPIRHGRSFNNAIACAPVFARGSSDGLHVPM